MDDENRLFGREDFNHILMRPFYGSDAIRCYTIGMCVYRIFIPLGIFFLFCGILHP